MKKGLIFATTLAMALGVGVAVGAHQGKAAEVKAEGETSTVYCKMTYDWWKTGNAAIAVHYWGGASAGTSWPGVRMSAVESDTDVWKYSVPSDVTGLMFVRVNGSGDIADWGAKTGDLTLPADKNLYTITSSSEVWGDPGVTGEWSAYVEPVPVPAEYHLLGDFNTWEDPDDEYVLTVDSEDSNHYTLSNVVMEKDDELKVCDVPHNLWYGNQDANVVVAEDGTYDVDFYVSADNNDHIVLTKQVTPEPTHTYKYYLNGDETGVVMTQSEDPEKQTEYESASLSFKVGDTLTFKKDDTVYAVAPKEDGAFTRVFDNAGVLTFAQAYEGKLYLETNGALLWAGQFEDGYYLFGTFNGWNPKLGRPAVLEGEVGPAYVVSGLTVAKDDEVEMISFPAEGKELSYHEADPNRVSTMTDVDFTVITGDVPEKGNIHFNKAGTYTIYFDPEAESGLGWYSIEDDNYVEPVYTVKVGDASYNLVSSDESEYKLDVEGDKIDLIHGTTVSVLKDGVLDGSFNAKQIGNNNLDADGKILANSEGQIYIDMALKTVFVGGMKHGGYHLLKNDTYVEMTHVEDYEGYQQYMAASVSFAANDTIKFVDTEGTDHLPNVWAIGIVNEAGLGKNFEVVKVEEEVQYIKCITACEASVYMKIKSGMDEVYFGDVPEYIQDAIEFSNGFEQAMAESCSAEASLKKAAVELAWSEAAEAFDELGDQAKAELRLGALSSQKEVREFGERYAGIYKQHAAKWELADFLDWKIEPNTRYGDVDFASEANNSTMIIIISIAAASVLAFTTLLVFKKRKQK